MKSHEIFKYILIICILIASNNELFAHNPSNSSTVLIKTKDSMWVLQIRASLTAFEQEVHTRFSKDSYKTPEEFSALISQIITTDLSLSFNNTQIDLLDLKVKLGHETVVFYQLKKSEDLESLHVKNKAFKNIYNSKNSLFILKDGLDKTRFTLSKANNFEANITVNENKLVLASKINKAETNIIWILFILILASLLIFLGFIILRNKPV